MGIFLRVGAWYRATNKALPSDIEITGIIDDPNAEYPTADEIQDGGATPTLDAVLAEGNDADGATIENLADPTTDQQVATKKYVDDNAGGSATLDEVLAEGAIATQKMAIFKVADDSSGVQVRDLDNFTKVSLGVDEDGNGYIEINNVKAAVETAANGTFTTITSITVVDGIITEITGS